MNQTLLTQILDSNLPDSAKLQLIRLQVTERDLQGQLDTLARLLTVAVIGSEHRHDESGHLCVKAEPEAVKAAMLGNPMFGIRELQGNRQGSVSEFTITLTTDVVPSSNRQPSSSDGGPPAA